MAKRVLALIVAACADAPAPVPADPAAPVAITLGDVVRIEPSDGAQNHATAALLPDGAVLVGTHDEGGLRVLTLDGAVDLDLPAPPPSWPQVTALGGGAAVFATGASVVFRPLVGEPTVLGGENPAYYPDVTALGDDILVVWSELDHLKLQILGGDAAILPLRTGIRTGPMTVRSTTDGALLAWSELGVEASEVYVAEVDRTGVVGEPVTVDRIEASLGARPGLAVRPDGSFAVAWRGWPRTEEASAWIAVYADGEPIAGPAMLGGIGRRPVLAPVGDLILAAWVEGAGDRRIVLQLFDGGLTPVGEAITASDGPSDDRPYLELVDGVGVLVWEGAGDVFTRTVTFGRPLSPTGRGPASHTSGAGGAPRGNP